jgi:hypothetical protein
LDLATAQPPATGNVLEDAIEKRSASTEDIRMSNAATARRVAELQKILAERGEYVEPTDMGPREKAFRAENAGPKLAMLAALSEEGSRAYNANRARSDESMIKLMQADREERMGGRPVEAGTMEQLVRFGGASPQAASKLTMNSPLVKALGQGALTPGLKLRARLRLPSDRAQERR